jgi:hypothetical protein
MNDSINLFNLAKREIQNNNTAHYMCPNNITLEMLIKELSGHEFDLTIDLNAPNIKDILWSSYYITMFSGNFGIHICEKDIIEKDCIVPILNPVHNNEITTENTGSTRKTKKQSRNNNNK